LICNRKHKYFLWLNVKPITHTVYYFQEPLMVAKIPVSKKKQKQKRNK